MKLKRLLQHIAFTIVLLTCGAAVAGVEWEIDLPDALKQAAAKNKAVLVDFTGSDWCPWCIKLKKEVFDQNQFADFANEKLICVEIDFPHYKAQTSTQQRENRALARKFSVTGYPTVLILNADGKVLLRTSYERGGAAPYIRSIQTALAQSQEPSAPAAPQIPDPPVTDTQTNAQPDPVSLVYLPQAEIRYDELLLKGISGGTKKIALINNQTFSAGEKAHVKLGDKKVGIECKEIREGSVLIQIEGEAESRELKLEKKN